ncbi:MAG: tetratricopeptide repeat protein [Candidatus Electrothrix sp. YB6]
MTSSVQDILDVLSPDAEKSLSFLAVPSYLDDELAAGILVQSELANGNTPELLEEIRSFPIWHEKGRTSWGIDDDVREYVLSKLNGSAESTRCRVLNALREVKRQSSQDNLHDEFDLQLARLSLTMEQEQPGGVAVLRQFFDLHHDETSRVVDLYIDESLSAEIPAGTLPDHLQSAYFMRGMYAHKNKQHKVALRFLDPVWKQRSGSPQSRHDAAVAAHIIGLSWSRQFRRHKDAETAFRESLELGQDNPHHQAQVWHSLGNLLSRNRQRHQEAETAYRKSLELEERNGNTFGQAQVWHSLGNLLSRNRQRHQEAETAYRKSLELGQDNPHHQAQVWHSLGNLLSRNRQRHQEAETAYRKSLELGQDNPHHQAQVWHSLGNLLSRNRQRHQEAETAYRKSLELEERNGNTFGQAQVWHSLGNLLSRNRQRHQEAETAYRKSLELEERNGNTFGQAQVWHSLGNLLSRNRQRHQEAETAYRKSLELGQDNPHHQAQVWHSFGNLLSRDRKRWPEAEGLYRKSYEFLSKSGDRRGVAMVASSFGRLLTRKGDYEQAEHWLLIALDNERIDYFRDKIKAQLEELAWKKAASKPER